MPIRMQDSEQMTLEQMRTLVDSNQTVRFSIEGREAFYNLVSRVLKHHGFARLSREHKGIVRRFLVKVTGRSRAQITRLIGQVDAIPFDSGQPARQAAVPEPVHGPRLRPICGGGSCARRFVRPRGATDTAPPI